MSKPKRYEDMTAEERIREASKNCPQCGLPSDLCRCSGRALSDRPEAPIGETLKAFTRRQKERAEGQKCGKCGHPWNALTWTVEDGRLKCPKCGALHGLVPA